MALTQNKNLMRMKYINWKLLLPAVTQPLFFLQVKNSSLLCFVFGNHNTKFFVQQLISQGMAYSKLRGLTFSLAWWIYITTCYSLLIDTIVLQSRGVAKLRNFCRQQTKNSRSLLLLLFFFLPLCLCAGWGILCCWTYWRRSKWNFIVILLIILPFAF